MKGMLEMKYECDVWRKQKIKVNITGMTDLVEYVHIYEDNGT